MKEENLDNSTEISPYNTQIKVLGIGGSGNNTINHLMKKKLKGLETVAINTDGQHLVDINSNKKILIGKNITAGLGSGGDPELGERAVRESKQEIIDIIQETDLLFITCGFGGGTGTGASPVVAKLAREEGILTVAIVTMPFAEEGIIRWENAKIGLEKLKKFVDTLIVLENNKLIDLYSELTLKKAFEASDDILINALEGLSSMVLKRGLVNLDFADISIVMKDGPNAFIGLGESDSENKIHEAIKRAITHPMMEQDISGAQSALIHITGGPSLKLKESRQIIKIITQKLDPNARIIWGATIQKNLRNTVKVLLIVSGLQKEKEIEERVSEAESEDTIINEFDESSIITNDEDMYDIKESILDSDIEEDSEEKSPKKIKQSGLIFYKIFKEEAAGDLQRFDRAIQLLREDPKNRRGVLEARQACKLLHASAEMFGFDETAQLLVAIETILSRVRSREMKITKKIIDSITLAMEMVVDLIENKTDGMGETGYIVDRLNELKSEQLNTYK
ncbi:MAG: cell division protein FtsZ [bacterium]